MTEITSESLAEFTAAINRLTAVKQEAKADGDGLRYAAADAGVAEVAKAASAAVSSATDAENRALRAEMEALRGEMKAALSNVRAPSLAAQIGPGREQEQAMALFQQAASPILKASLGASYQSGSFLTALLDATLQDGDRAAGKARLTSMGLAYMNAPEGKATLGTTGATGGYVLPNNLVASVEKPMVQEAVYTGVSPLVTVINGVMVRGIDQPYRTGSPTRLTSQNWGVAKNNRDEAYGTYTATLGTFAAIFDQSKQYARFSAGAAETDVLDELAKASRLAENYAVIAGPGTGSATPGTNDPTKGVYTSLLGNVFTTAHSASSSTVAGSAAAGLAKAFGALAGRSRTPSAAVMDAVSYWTLFSQGSDSAGFWLSDFLGAGFATGADNILRWRGVPIFFDANFDTNTGTTKAAIVGDWKSLKFYRGLEFRIDASDIAGTRWDNNLIGYRGEEEYGVNADTAVAVGAFQLITGIIP
jgi:HK97 family phage major capsid protein